MESVCPSMVTRTSGLSLRIWAASSSTGANSGLMLDLLKSKLMPRRIIFFGRGGGAGGGGGGGGGGRGGRRGRRRRSLFRSYQVTDYSTDERATNGTIPHIFEAFVTLRPKGAANPCASPSPEDRSSDRARIPPVPMLR